MTKNSLGKNAFYNIVYKVLNVFFPLISTAYISRVLLAEGVGRVSAVNNNVSYFLILATLGIPAYGLREIAKVNDDKNKKNTLFSELFILNAIFSLFSYCLFILLTFTVSYFKHERILYEIYGSAIVLNIINVDWLFQGMEEYAYIATRSSIIKIISLFALFLLVKNKNDIYLYAIINVIAISGNYIFNIVKARKYVRFKFKKLCLRRHLRPLIYLALCTISTELYAKMDITMLDILKGSKVVGYYTNSQKLINLGITMLVAVTAVFLPRLSYLFDNDKEEFNKILKVGYELMIFISIPACFGLMVISKPLILFFLGKSFVDATLTTSILALMIPLKCIGDLICYQVMMCARQEAILMKSYFIIMFVNLVNNFLLIPQFGAEGAAVASVISEILAFGFVYYYSRKYFEIYGVKWDILKTVVSTCIMVIFIIRINYLSISYMLKLIIEVCLGITIYLASCLLLKHEGLKQYIVIIKYKISFLYNLKRRK